MSPVGKGKKAIGVLSPEAAKLSEKVKKDPNSRLFLPLSEEYLKAGMLDEAVKILNEGLKLHTTFHAAKGMLGRVLLEKGELAKAKAEFEQVIRVSPDNLLAHRKLAGIYRDEGAIEKARISCQAVLDLNPKDEEMQSVMQDLERASKNVTEQVTVGLNPVSDEAPVERTAHTDLESKINVQESKTMALEPTSAVSETAAPESPAPEIMKTEPARKEAPPVVTPLPPVSAEAPVKPEVLESAPVQEPAQQESPEASPADEEIATETLGDLYIKQGHYKKGIAIHRRLLAENPGNQALFKKLDETIERVRLLQEGSKIKPAVKPNPEQAKPVVPEAPGGPAEAPPPGGAQMSEQEKKKRDKMDRLQLWLNNLKKGQVQ